MNEYDSALVYYNRVFEIRQEIGIKKDIAASYNNLGLIYKNIDNFEMAFENYSRATELYEEIGDNKNAAAIINNIGNLYLKHNDTENAIIYFKKAFLRRNEIGDEIGIALSAKDLGDTYLQLDLLSNAKGYLEKAEKIAKIYEEQNILRDVYYSLYQLYKKENNFKQALAYQDEYSRVKDNISTEENIKRIADMQIRYETEKREKEITLIKKENQIKELEYKDEIRRKQTLLYVFIFGFIVISFFLWQIFRQNRKIKLANFLLDTQNKEIRQQKEEIEAQRDEIEKQKNIAEGQRDQIENQKLKITDSITYASRIQAALLPPEKYINEILPEHFIFLKPRDIVSGDFYWMTKKENKTIVAAADCTGHGVPGAFMSMLGVSLLNEIINRNDVLEPDIVLNILRDTIKHSLHQTGDEDEPSDGMDISICFFDFENKKLQFAGANN